MPMTPKENIIAVLNHETREWIPSSLSDTVSAGFGSGPGPAFEKGPLGGGPDGFGINWVTPASGGGAPIPEPGHFLMNAETIVDWKKLVKFPDLSSFDWETQAKAELSFGNPDIQAVDFGSGNGPFERMATLMGFEEALMAMYEEPEACFELMDAIADYKIQVAEYAKKYYHADLFTNYDDIATERGLFMSPESYRALIKPAHTKINDAVRALGMIPIQHTCGKADALTEDFNDTHAAAWTSVQPTNDISGILEKYGDQFCIIGGYDSNGLPGQVAASDETVIAEVKRCFDTYGIYSSYIFFGFRIVNSVDPQVNLKAIMPLITTSAQYGRELIEKA